MTEADICECHKKLHFHRVKFVSVFKHSSGQNLTFWISVELWMRRGWNNVAHFSKLNYTPGGNKSHWNTDGLKLCHRLRQWTNIKPALFQCHMFTGLQKGQREVYRDVNQLVACVINEISGENRNPVIDRIPHKRWLGMNISATPPPKKLYNHLLNYSRPILRQDS